MKKISILISTIFGIGYFPKAPGTAGSIFAAIIYFFLPNYWFANTIKSIILLLCILGLSIISVYFISIAEKILGHDNKKIIIDEFWGYFITILFLPKGIILAVSGLFFFRIFDIFKPEPVNVLQKLPKGWGVIADDLMAGIYGNICLQIINLIFPNLMNS